MKRILLSSIGIVLFAFSIFSQTETIKIYRVGSSSFSNKLANQIEDMIESSGDYQVIWGESGYTRMDQWADGQASYSAWIDAKMPEIILGDYDYVIFQTIGWFSLNPSQQDTLYYSILPDLVQKVRAAGAEIILYDKYPTAGCYDDWIRSNNLFHIKACMEAGINHIAWGGNAMRYLRPTPYFDGMLSFYDMTGHPGPMTDYMSACNISYMITGVDPRGSSMTNISIQGFCNDTWWPSLETENPTFYNAHKDRVVNEHLQLTAWEADTLQNTAMWSHLTWMDTLAKAKSDAAFYNKILAEIDTIHAHHGEWDNFENPEDYSDIAKERCNPLNAITLSEAELLAILDTVKMFSDRVEQAAETYLTAGEYNQLKQDNVDYWQSYNSKFRDDTYYMLLVELQLERNDSTPDLAEIARLEEQSEVFREILSLPVEGMLIDLLSPADSAAFVSSFSWTTPLSTYAPKFGQAQIDNAADWREVETLRDMYLELWINNDRMDTLRDNSYPLQAWLTVDDLFAAEYASFVPGFRTLEIVGNGLYQDITITPNQASYALGSSVSINTSTYLGYEFKNWSGDASGSDNPLTITMDENKKIIANYSFVDDGIIIDNDAGFPTCVVANGAIVRTGDANTFGSNALKLKIEPDVKVRWAPNFKGNEGEYEIFVWYPVGGSTDAPYYISHDGGTDLINFDQSTGSGIWQSLGKYNMSVGSYLELDASISTGTRPLADAARFVYTGVAYSINVSAVNGSVIKSPNKATYSQDEVVSLTANPSLGYSFDSWSGDVIGSDNPTSVTMDGNKSITANFIQDKYTITFHVSDASGDVENAEVTFNATSVNTNASGDAVFTDVVYTLGMGYSISKTGYNTTSGIVDATTSKTENVSISLATTPTYTVTITSGTGSGDYEEGATVSITADAAATGKEFSQWTGDIELLTDASVATTSFTMPDSAIELTATYVDVVEPTYTVTITNGTGSGDYQEGTTVSISADPAIATKEFNAWIGDIEVLASATEASTSFTMPDSAIELTATYKDAPIDMYTVTITNGTGSGDYEEGETVNISADAAPTGQEFDTWTGDVAVLTDATSATGSFSMPDSAIELSVTYKDIETGISESGIFVDVYPNPASNVLMISANVSVEYIQIVSLTGKLVLEGDIHSRYSAIDISEILNGIYFININLEDNSHQIIKMVKK